MILLKTSKIQFTKKIVRLEESLEACLWELCTWGLQLKDNRAKMKVLFLKEATHLKICQLSIFLMYFPFSSSNGKYAWFYFLHSTFFCSPAS